MTSNRNFKRLVRERMTRTGERYATARAHVLAAEAGATPEPIDAATARDGASNGVFDGVTAIGGQQSDLAAARNLCTNAGVVGPDGAPLSEAMAFGLAGGIGFLYGQFTYESGPTMTIVARHASMPDPFIEPLFGRVGATVDVATTGGAKKAASTLDASLADRRPSLCTVGVGGLRYTGESAAMAAMAPQIVGVVGSTPDGEVLVDDRAPVALTVDRAEFDTARAAYRKAKHRLVTISAIDPSHDWEAALVEAVATAASRYDTPPVPQFAANIGFAGLRKLHRLLTDQRDAKGWPKTFGSGRLAAIGLSRLVDGIDHTYTAPSAGRLLYADFLDEAASYGADDLDAARLGEAAEQFRAAGRGWAAIVDAATSAHPAIARHDELAGERAAAVDDGNPDPGAMAALAEQQQALIDGCDLDETVAVEVFASIAEHVEAVIAAELDAMQTLSA